MDAHAQEKSDLWRWGGVSDLRWGGGGDLWESVGVVLDERLPSCEIQDKGRAVGERSREIVRNRYRRDTDVTLRSECWSCEVPTCW